MLLGLSKYPHIGKFVQVMNQGTMGIGQPGERPSAAWRTLLLIHCLVISSVSTSSTTGVQSGLDLIVLF